jgi:hypothetical protein
MNEATNDDGVVIHDTVVRAEPPTVALPADAAGTKPGADGAPEPSPPGSRSAAHGASIDFGGVDPARGVRPQVHRPRRCNGNRAPFRKAVAQGDILAALKHRGPLTAWTEDHPSALRWLHKLVDAYLVSSAIAEAIGWLDDFRASLDAHKPSLILHWIGCLMPQDSRRCNCSSYLDGEDCPHTAPALVWMHANHMLSNTAVWETLNR